jgi:hypothetical protein
VENSSLCYQGYLPSSKKQLALGISGCQSLKLKETLAWLLAHEPHPHVKTEAIKACRFVMRQSSECTNIKDYLIILLQSESSNEIVKKEAEKALASIGIQSNVPPRAIPQSSGEDSLSSSKSGSLASTNTLRRRSSIAVSRRKSSAVPGVLTHVPSKSTLPTSNVRKFARRGLKAQLDATVEETSADTTPSDSQEFVVAPPVAAVVKDDAVMNPIGLYANFTAEEIEVISSSDIITQASINSVIEQVRN